MRRTRLFLLGLVLVFLVEAARQWNSTPGRVPSQFDAAGRPNAWSSRDEFFFLQVGVTSLASRGGNLATNYFLPVLVSNLLFSAGWTVAPIRTFAKIPTDR